MSTKNIVLLVLGVIIVGGGIFFATKRGMYTPVANPMQTATQQSNEVVIENYKFTPNMLTVKKGTTVTWMNNDPVQHIIASDTAGTGPASGALGKGQTYSYTFDNVGTHSYHCAIHPTMTGSVVVTE